MENESARRVTLTPGSSVKRWQTSFRPAHTGLTSETTVPKVTAAAANEQDSRRLGRRPVSMTRIAPASGASTASNRR